MNRCQPEGEQDQIEQIEKDDVEGPAHHIVMWIEDVEDEDEDRHNEVGAEADEVADRVPAAHLSVNFLESFVDFLCADASDHLPEVQRHSED